MICSYPSSWVSVFKPALHVRILWFPPILRCRCARAYSSWTRSTCDSLSLSYSQGFSKGFNSVLAGWLKDFSYSLSEAIRVWIHLHDYSEGPGQDLSPKNTFSLVHSFLDMLFVFHSFICIFLQVHDEIPATAWQQVTTRFPFSSNTVGTSTKWQVSFSKTSLSTYNIFT